MFLFEALGFACLPTTTHPGSHPRLIATCVRVCARVCARVVLVARPRHTSICCYWAMLRLAPKCRNFARASLSTAQKPRADSPEARVAEKVVAQSESALLGAYAHKVRDRVSADAIQMVNLQQIEDEFRQEIAQALGRSEVKLVGAMREMKLADLAFSRARQGSDKAALKLAVDALNARIDAAEQARLELIVHVRSRCACTPIHAPLARSDKPWASPF
jgi:hypothetical protein